VCVWQEEKEIHSIHPHNSWTNLDILFEKHVKETEAKKSDERENHHAGFVAKVKEVNEWIGQKFNKDRAGTVEIKPARPPQKNLNLIIVGVGIRGVESGIQVVYQRKQDVIVKKQHKNPLVEKRIPAL